jgi:hypothetical protein
MTSLTANIGALPCSLQKMILNLAMEPVLESAARRHHTAKMTYVLKDFHFINSIRVLDTSGTLHQWLTSEVVQREIADFKIQTMGNIIAFIIWTGNPERSEKSWV